jgi:hypothetical protein
MEFEMGDLRFHGGDYKDCQSHLMPDCQSVSTS